MSQRGAVARWLAVICLLALSAAASAQPHADPKPAGPAASASTSTSAPPVNTQNAAAAQPAPQPEWHGILSLDGPWRLQVGDDPRFADPNFDDSQWPTVSLSQSLFDQGIDSYSGYAWYRMRIPAQQIAQIARLQGGTPIDLLVTGDSIGQVEVYIDGGVAGGTRGMSDKPTMYLSPPFDVHAIHTGNDPVVIAVRTWAGADVHVLRGLLDKVELGSKDEIADRLDMTVGRQWDEHVLAALFVMFLYLGVAGLGAALYLSQRNHSEYLWLALLCVSVTVGGLVDVLYGAGVMPLTMDQILSMWLGRIFMAITLEFAVRFTTSQKVRLVRIVQISVLVIPVFHLLHWDRFYEYLSISAEVTFCTMVCVLLWHAWRRGRREAGVMLVPFFLAATADSIDTILDYLARIHWLPDRFASHRYHLGPIEFGTSTVTYTVFLGSLIAVILYRFLRVSEDEQRSAAEISAARSVQALLIPTQLPSNRNFMLESAYLPAHGVGGDFFQVLPLKDDSLLVVVGDVSGKGLQAAMNASTLVGALRNELSHDPATVLNHLNHVLLGAVPSPSKVQGLDAAPCFATCLCARIYPDGRMTMANAGHLSPYRDGREMETAPGLPLGVIAEIEYEQATVQLNRGERVIFLSDGVVEATNEHGELFGFERTQQVSNEPARYIAQTAKRFGQNDDITVVSVYLAARTAHRANEEAVVTR